MVGEDIILLPSGVRHCDGRVCCLTEGGVMAKSKYSEETKMAVVLEGLRNGSSIAELCRKHGISDALYYRWRDQFLEGGKRALSGKLGNPNEELRRRLSEYEKVIGRLTVQNEILKKTFPE